MEPRENKSENTKPIMPSFTKGLDYAAQQTENQNPKRQKAIQDALSILREAGVVDLGLEQVAKPIIQNAQLAQQETVKQTSRETLLVPKELDELRNETNNWYETEKGRDKIWTSFMFVALANAGLAQYQRQLRQNPNFDAKRFIDKFKYVIEPSLRSIAGIYVLNRNCYNKGIHSSVGSSEEIKQFSNKLVSDITSTEDVEAQLRKIMDPRNVKSENAAPYFVWTMLFASIFNRSAELFNSKDRKNEDLLVAFTACKTVSVYLEKYGKLYPKS